MEKSNKKALWALGLVAGLGVLAVAYATLTSNLSIAGSGTASVYGVEFDDVTDGTSNYWLGIGQDKSDAVDGTKNDGTGNFNPTYKGDDKTSDPTAVGLGNGGTLARSSSNSSNQGENDTITISDIKLYDEGAYVDYVLNMTNHALNKMYLTKVDVTVTDAEGSSSSVADKFEVRLGATKTDAASTYPSISGFTSGTAKNCTNATPYASAFFSDMTLPAATSEAGAKPAGTSKAMPLQIRYVGPATQTKGSVTVKITPHFSAVNPNA